MSDIDNEQDPTQGTPPSTQQPDPGEQLRKLAQQYGKAPATKPADPTTGDVDLRDAQAKPDTSDDPGAQLSQLAKQYASPAPGKPTLGAKVPFKAEEPPELPHRILSPELQPAGPFAAENAKAFQPAKPPTVAPVDASRAATPLNREGGSSVAKALGITNDKSLAGRVANALGDMAAHPVETAKGIVMTPLEAAMTLDRASAELDAANAIAQAGGDPSTVERTVTPKQAAIAAAQLGSLALGPEAEALLGKMAAPFVGEIANRVGMRAGEVAARGASIVTKGAVGAGIGATFSPDDPAVGAVIGGGLGALHAAASGSMVVPNVKQPPQPAPAPAPAPNMANQPGKLIPSTKTNIGKATARVVPDPTAPTGAAAAPLDSPFSVEMNTPAQALEQSAKLSGKPIGEQLIDAIKQRRAADREANTDALTGLGNQNAYKKAVVQAESDPNTVVIRFDVNGFKAVNDVHGHAAGDETLKTIAQHIRDTAKGLPAFRAGGDEFAVIAPATDAPAIRDAIEKAVGVRELQASEADATGNRPTTKFSISGGIGATDKAADAAAIARKSAQKAAQGIGPRGVAATTETAAQGQPAPSAGQNPTSSVRSEPLENLDVEPERFQYKLNTNEKGVGRELESVKQWNPDLAGVIGVWRDPADGRLKVVNGHHRYDLAQRNNVPSVDVRELNAPDAATARATGAIINIAEGRGTAIDAAKLFRDSQMSPEDLEKRGVSLTGQIAKDGLALAKLHPAVFDQVVSGKMPVARAAVIGGSGLEPEQQLALTQMLEKREASGKRMTNEGIGELIRFVKGAGTETSTQESLFGEEQLTHSLAPEKAELSAYVKDRLAKDRRLFGFLTKGGRAERVEGAGVGQIQKDRAGEVATRAAQAEELYNKLSTMSGPISDALNDAARRLAKGENANAIRQSLYESVSNAVRTETGSASAHGEGEGHGRGGSAPAPESNGAAGESGHVVGPARDKVRWDNPYAGKLQAASDAQLAELERTLAGLHEASHGQPTNELLHRDLLDTRNEIEARKRTREREDGEETPPPYVDPDQDGFFGVAERDPGEELRKLASHYGRKEQSTGQHYAVDELRPLREFLARHEDALTGGEIRMLRRVLPESELDAIASVEKIRRELGTKGNEPLTPEAMKKISPFFDFEHMHSKRDLLATMGFRHDVENGDAKPGRNVSEYEKPGDYKGGPAERGPRYMEGESHHERALDAIRFGTEAWHAMNDPKTRVDMSGHELGQAFDHAVREGVKAINKARGLKFGRKIAELPMQPDALRYMLMGDSESLADHYRGFVDTAKNLGLELKQAATNELIYRKHFPSKIASADEQTLFGLQPADEATRKALHAAIATIQGAVDIMRRDEEATKYSAETGDMRQFGGEHERGGIVPVKSRPFEPVKAYHGSPHKFDNFSLDHVGNGEGAQTFGWGLYFASLKSVAQYYRDKLVNNVNPPMAALRKYFAPGSIVHAYGGMDRVISFNEHDPVSDWSVRVRRVLWDSKRGEGEYVDAPGESIRVHSTAPSWYELRRVLGDDLPKPGGTYHVELPDASEFLEWDKPVSKQSPQVKKAIEGLGRETSFLLDHLPYAEWFRKHEFIGDKHTAFLHWTYALRDELQGTGSLDRAIERLLAYRGYTHGQEYTRDQFIEKILSLNPTLSTKSVPFSGTGQELYDTLRQQEGSKQAASELLRAAGVPGIRYLDQGSRASGEGTHNYVVFDDSKINVTAVEEPRLSAKRTQVAIFDKHFLEAKTEAEMAEHDNHHRHAFSTAALNREDNGALAYQTPEGSVSVTVGRNASLDDDTLRKQLRAAGLNPNGATVIRQNPHGDDTVYQLGERGDVAERHRKQSYDPAQADLFAQIAAKPNSPEANALRRDEAEKAFGSEKKRDAIAEQMQKLERAGVPTSKTRLAEMRAAEKTRRKGWIDLRGQLASSPAKVMKLMQAFRHPGVERLHVLLLDDLNRIVSHTADTSGSIGFVDTTGDSSWTRDIIDRARRLGVTRAIIVHNHPSGNPTPSKDDFGFTATIGHELETQGIRLVGHLVIDHEEGSWLKPARDETAVYGIGRDRVFIKDAPAADWITSYEKDRPLANADYVAQLVRDVGDPNGVTVIYLDSQYRIVAVEPRVNKSAETVATWLRAQQKAHGARFTIIAAPYLAAGAIRAEATRARGGRRTKSIQEMIGAEDAPPALPENLWAHDLLDVLEVSQRRGDDAPDVRSSLQSDLYDEDYRPAEGRGRTHRLRETAGELPEAAGSGPVRSTGETAPAIGVNDENRGSSQLARARDESRDAGNGSDRRRSEGGSGGAAGAGSVRPGEGVGGQESSLRRELPGTDGQPVEQLSAAELYRREKAKRGMPSTPAAEKPKREVAPPPPATVDDTIDDTEHDDEIPPPDHFSPGAILARLKGTTVVDKNGSPLVVYYATGSASDDPRLQRQREDYTAPHMQRGPRTKAAPEQYGWDYDKARAAMLASGAWTDAQLSKIEKTLSLSQRYRKPVTGLSALIHILEQATKIRLQPGHLPSAFRSAAFWSRFDGLVDPPVGIDRPLGIRLHTYESSIDGKEFNSTRIYKHPVYVNIRRPLRLPDGGLHAWTYDAVRAAMVLSGHWTDAQINAWERATHRGRARVNVEGAKGRVAVRGIDALRTLIERPAQGRLADKFGGHPEGFDGIVYRNLDDVPGIAPLQQAEERQYARWFDAGSPSDGVYLQAYHDARAARQQWQREHAVDSWVALRDEQIEPAAPVEKLEGERGVDLRRNETRERPKRPNGRVPLDGESITPQMRSRNMAASDKERLAQRRANETPTEHAERVAHRRALRRGEALPKQPTRGKMTDEEKAAWRADREARIAAGEQLPRLGRPPKMSADERAKWLEERTKRLESGDDVRPLGPRGVKERDLFGNEDESYGASSQSSLFGDNAGAEKSRSLKQTETAARSELEKLQQQEKLETSPAKRLVLARRMAELEKLLNRHGAIGADELRTRARAEATDENARPGDEGDGGLFSPTRRVEEPAGSYSGGNNPRRSKPPMPEPSGLGASRSKFRPLEVVRKVKAILHPETLGKEASATGGNIRHVAAERFRAFRQAHAALRELEQHIEKQPRQRQVELWDDYENGRPTGDSYIDHMNDVFRQTTELRTDELIKLDRLKGERAIMNYVGRFWETQNSGPDVADFLGAVFSKHPIDNVRALTKKRGAATDHLRTIFAKRPFEGPKSFLKRRSIEHFVDGLNAGLVPATYNYVSSQLAKIQEMERLIGAEHMLRAEQQSGRAKPVMLGMDPPLDVDGNPWVKIDREGNDPAFTIYAPPFVPHWEALDAVVYQKLSKLMQDLRIKHTRKLKIGGAPGTAGWAREQPEEMTTKFGGSEGVIMHELGHILDYRYKLGREIKNAIGKAPTRTAKSGKKAGQQVPDYSKKGGETPQTIARRKRLRDELRELANMRLENASGSAPRTEDLTPAQRAYLHSRPEMMANMVHAYVGARDVFKRVAPGIFEIFDNIVGQHPELHTLRTVRPSLNIGAQEIIERLPGPPLAGHWYAPRTSAPVWANHLSKGLHGNPVYDALTAPGSAATQILLGVSGFHGTVIATEGMFSDLVLASEHAMEADAKSAAKALARVVGSPVTSAISSRPFRGKKEALAFGAKVMQQYDHPGSRPELEKVLQAMVAGGFRGTEKSELWSGERVDKLKLAVRQALHGNTKLRKAWGASKIPLDAIYAGVELLSAPLMSRYVPLMKTAATYNAVAKRLAELPANIDPDRFHREMWDIVKEMDYRFGQVTYENHFVNNVAKHLGQALFLAPGWTFGTVALASRGVRDFAVAPKRLYDRATGKPGAKDKPIIGRSGKYWIAAIVGTALLNALLTYFATGDQPGSGDDGWKDFFAFRDGTFDADGNANRHTIPGYLMHDVYGWTHHPYKTFLNKLSPFFAFSARVAKNENYFGDLMRDPDAPWPTQLKQTMGEAGRELGTPLSYQNFVEGRKRGEEGLGEIARNAFGVTPAKREFVRTDAQNQMTDYLARRGHTAATPEEAAVRDERQGVLLGLRDANPDVANKIREAIEHGDMTPPDLERMLKRAGMLPLAEKYKSLTLEQALEVFNRATPWERGVFADLLSKKIDRAAKSP